MGWIADPMSALNESELRVAVEGGELAPEGGARRALGGGVVGARYSGETITVNADVSPALLEGGSGDPTLGNLRVGVGLRTIGTNLGGLYRRGLGIRASLAIDPEDNEADRGVSGEIALLRPIDHLRFASGQSYEQVVEARYELVGCHAPFLHVQAGFRARKDADSSTFAMPFSVTVGAHPNAARYWRLPQSTVYVDYSAVVGRLPTRDDDVDVVQRFRFALALDDVNIVFHADSQFGVGDGWLVGAAYHLPMKWGRDE
jgi:hypothetical protein